MNDAAEFFGYSKNYFCKWLQNSIGTGFSEFLNVVRISHACAYLLDGYTIEATAELCGYTDSSYFIKVFKKFRGTTRKITLPKNSVMTDIKNGRGERCYIDICSELWYNK